MSCELRVFTQLATRNSQLATMLSYIIRRLLILPITLIGLSMLIFLMLQFLTPAERASLYISGPIKTSDELARIEHKYGLDKPVYEQYLAWVQTGLHGDLGFSKTAGRPVLEGLATYFPATLELALWSFIPIMFGGIWLGIAAASKHDKFIDQAARIFSIVGYAFPTFVFGLLILMIFYAALQWFPPGRLSDWATNVVLSPAFHTYTGMYSIDALLNLRLDIFLDAVRHIVMPAL